MQKKGKEIRKNKSTQIIYDKSKVTPNDIHTWAEIALKCLNTDPAVLQSSSSSSSTTTHSLIRNFLLMNSTIESFITGIGSDLLLFKPKKMVKAQFEEG